jgi:3',5'-cyclic AMP phosphodiesterase CpdA
MHLKNRNTLFVFSCSVLMWLIHCQPVQKPLGQNEALRTYTEFADGTHRGIYNPETDSGGFPDEDYDATTAMVINWHRMPEEVPELDSRLRYRQIHPSVSSWQTAGGESFEFWYRDERVNRVVLKGLEPGSVYEYKVREEGEVFRFRTMPGSLEERPLRIVMTADHQSPDWNRFAHDNAKLAALQKPDMFIVAGDFVNDEGNVTLENAERWARYLDHLYNIEDGYFFYEKEIGGQRFENLVIPHLSVLGNHETGQRNHIRWPACVNTGMEEPGYPQFVAANWMQLLFHWPYSSEGFYSEFLPDHPNMDPAQVREGYGKGGFGKLSFGDYLLLIGLDNSQNWEAAPDTGLRDWEGNLITERWPWFETHHSDVRQDQWLKNLLEPDEGLSAGERFKHILPVWHRGLFGTVRLNMSLKNREMFSNWLPLLYRNGVRLIKEGHDHLYTRTVPLNITTEQPENTVMEPVYYEPNTWELTSNLSSDYLDQFYSVNTLVDTDSGEIVGWEYDGYYSTYDPQGMIGIGHGGWAAGRRDPGGRGGGNAGLWFVDEARGGESFGGEESFHINVVELSKDGLTVSAWHPGQLETAQNGGSPQPFHQFRWDQSQEAWFSYDAGSGEWNSY